MQCPHCLKAFHSSPRNEDLIRDNEFSWKAVFQVCPSCGKAIIGLKKLQTNGYLLDEFLVYPKGISRAPLSKDVPDDFASDYREACLVASDSPKASAALSRRCLQHVLVKEGGVTKKNLVAQIEEVMPDLPSYLQKLIDGVRNIGNFAAHPIKSEHTGEIIDVEPGEAELLLETLEMLFDFYFVKPAEAQRKRDAIDEKLSEAGKPPMK